MEIFYTDDTLVVDSVSRPGIPFLLDASMREVRVVNDYLYHVSATLSCSPDTRRTYAADLCEFFSFLERNGIAWDRVSGTDIVAWRDQVGVRGKLTTSTINQRLRAAARLYAWAVKGKYIGESPFDTRQVAGGPSSRFPFHRNGRGSNGCAYVVTRRDFKRVPRVLEMGDAKIFISALAQMRDRLAACLMLETGLRRTEATRLSIAVLPRPTGCAEPRMLKMTLNPDLTPTKGGTERWVQVSSVLVNALWKYIRTHRKEAAERYRARKGGNPPGMVFLSSSGEPLSRSHLDKAFKEAGAKCGIACTPHVLRHTFATHELNRAKQRWQSEATALLWVKERLGHASIEATMIYLHLAKHAAEKTLDAHQQKVTRMIREVLNG